MCFTSINYVFFPHAYRHMQLKFMRSGEYVNKHGTYGEAYCRIETFVCLDVLLILFVFTNIILSIFSMVDSTGKVIF